MLFPSLEFLFLFFPITVAVYFFLPHSARNYWLLVVSMFFYAWGEGRLVILLIGSVVCNYFAALHIEELSRKSAAKKLMLAVAVALNLGLLFVFKYLNFLTANLQGIFPSLPTTSIVLPIGISFFTFQGLSYVIDVYRGIPAQHNICHLGLYISFFPQLIAGPIVRYTTIMDQIPHRTITLDGFANGVVRFLRGFCKKVLFANLMAEVADAAFAARDLSVSMAWLGAICYSLQIFFDFGGYSEMAIGLGQMFGFQFLENFNYPYIAKTISEFWRRWHISLGSWFRDYLYFPLGGSRVKSKLRLVFNLAVVWLATGIWHGANWTFHVWGVLHGVFVIVEKLLSLPQRVEKNGALSAIYRVLVLLVVVFGWVIFRADNLPAAVNYIKAMLGLSGNPVWDVTFRFHLREYAAILIPALICCTPVLAQVRQALAGNPKTAALWDGGSKFALLGLFIIGVSFIVMNAHNPFIYFNF